MTSTNEKFRLCFSILCITGAFVFCSYSLVKAHFDGDNAVQTPRYEFEYELQGRRGAIFDSSQTTMPLVKSVPVWEYRLDPVALTNAVVRPSRKEKPRKKEAILRTIADQLNLDYAKLLDMAKNTANRYQFLAQSSDSSVHRVLANSSLVAGIVIEEKQNRQYFHARRLSHVLGSVNKQGTPSAGLELKFNRELSGVPGRVKSKRDARGRELYDKRIEKIAPIPGSNIYLTIDNNLQYETETALAWGIKTFEAASGWAVILDSATGAVLALSSLPDFNPLEYGKATDNERINRAINYTYEPGSVMKVITASAALDLGRVKLDSLYSTKRDEEGYYKLPGDGSHVWNEKMSIRDAIAHSSNIVIGKLAYDLGPKNLWEYQRAFGFGEKTLIELPGEETGILRSWQRWDKATWSRAGIGHGLTATAIQIASAYQAIANNGERVQPHIINRIVNSNGNELYSPPKNKKSYPIKKETSIAIRKAMLDVASSNGTARRAAIRGYSVAGKTGTAQKAKNGRYLPGLYCATFCGIVPSGVVKKNETDRDCVPSRLVILVSLDFEKNAKFHQGGNSAAPTFKRIATAALRYLAIEPDRPNELMDFESDDEFAIMMDERANALANEEDCEID